MTQDEWADEYARSITKTFTMRKSTPNEYCLADMGDEGPCMARGTFTVVIESFREGRRYNTARSVACGWKHLNRKYKRWFGVLPPNYRTPDMQYGG